MSRRLPAAVLILALQGAVARADDVYTWTDASGETHYTNDPATIPEKARRAAHKLEGDTGSVLTPRSAPESKPAPEPEPEKGHPAADAQPPPPEPIETGIQPPREDEKVSEEQWRSLFRKSSEKVRRAERKAQRTRDALAKLPGQDLTSYDYSGNVVVDSHYERLKLQLDEDEYQLNAAREELHDLERAAAREAIPLEWRR